MARIKIMYWKEIPIQIQAEDVQLAGALAALGAVQVNAND